MNPAKARQVLTRRLDFIKNKVDAKQGSVSALEMYQVEICALQTLLGIQPEIIDTECILLEKKIKPIYDK